MNDTLISQPLSDTDVSNFMTSVSNPTGTPGAQLAAQKMLVSIASTQTVGPNGTPKNLLTSNQVFAALAAGANSTGDAALYEGLALVTSLIGSWGALVLLCAGVIQIISWAQKVEAWVASVITTLTGIFTALEQGAGAALGSLMSVFGIGTPVKKDAKSVVSTFSILATGSAPMFAAVMNLLESQTGSVNIPGGNGGGTSSSSSSSMSSSASASSAGGSSGTSGSTSSKPSSQSASGAGGGSSSAAPNDRRRKRDMTSLGIRSRRTLLRTRQ